LYVNERKEFAACPEPSVDSAWVSRTKVQCFGDIPDLTAYSVDPIELVTAEPRRVCLVHDVQKEVPVPAPLFVSVECALQFGQPSLAYGRQHPEPSPRLMQSGGEDGLLN
jgi:hypothetical protein